MTTNAQEVPFLSGMPRDAAEMPAGQDDTLTRWRLDQLLHESVTRLTIPMREAVQAAMSGMRAAMASRATNRGFDPDVADPIEAVRGEELEPRIRRERPVQPRNDWGLWVSLASLAITLGSILFWTGRFTAQAEGVAKTQADQAAQIKADETANARQDVTLGIIDARLSAIQGTVTRIETKVDDRH